MAKDSTTLFLFGEEETKTMVDALLSAYGAADLHARSMEAMYQAKAQELEDTKKKLAEAEKKLVVLDAAYADMDDERADWRDKYMKLLADTAKKDERKGQ